MTEILMTILRAILTYLLLLVATRLVERKVISQMTFFDFVVAITFGSLTANLSIGNGDNPSLNATIVITIFGMLAVLSAKTSLLSILTRKIIDSEPLVMIA